MELRGVREGELGCLVGHGLADLGNAVADVDYGGLAAGIEVSPAGLVDDPAAFAANGSRIGFAKVSREERGVFGHDDRRIVAERKIRIERCGRYSRPSDRAEMGCSSAALLRESVIRWRAFPG